MEHKRYDWLDPRNARMYELLIQAFPTTGEVVRLAQRMELELGGAAPDGPSAGLWRFLLETTTASGQFSDLKVEVMTTLNASTDTDLVALRDELFPLFSARRTRQEAEPGAPGVAPRSPEAVFLDTLLSVDEEVEAEDDISTEQALDLFKEKFCNPRSESWIQVRPDQVLDMKPIINGKAFRLDVEYEGEHSTAQMYVGLGKLSGRLWNQEAGTLLRLSGRQHLALPEVVKGVVRDDDGIGLIISKTRAQPFSAEDLVWIRRTPEMAVRWFELVADALRELRANGIMHRAIWRGAVEMRRSEREVPLSAVLSRFEMSAFLASLIDPTRRVTPQWRKIIRQYHRRGGAASLMACSPEQLMPLLGIKGSGGFLDYQSDVYSLGVVAYEWFVGDLPFEAFARELGGEPQHRTQLDLDRACGVFEAPIRQAPGLPEPLADLIVEMLSPRPSNRPTAFQVVNRLAMHHNRLVAARWKTTEDPPYLVSIAPEFILRHLYVEPWRGLSQDPDIFFSQVQSRIERDLSPAQLVYVPGGAGQYLPSGQHETLAESVYALIGNTTAIYFCQPYRYQRQTEVPWVLHVNYAVDRSYDGMKELRETPLQRTIRSVRAVHYTKSGEVKPAYQARHNPLWTTLLQDVQYQKRQESWYAGLKAGLNWWLRLQEALLEVHMYPYEQVPHPDPDAGVKKLVRLRHLQARDQTWLFKDDLRDMLANDLQRHPPFGDFFFTLEERELGLDVTWLPDREGRPDFGTAPREAPSARVAERISPQEIDLVLQDDVYPPREGWLRPKKDLATETQIKRQRHGRRALYANLQQLRSLYDPWSFTGSRIPWRKAGAQLSEEGSARQILQNMLATFPFYALQGPPGTGKTTLVANAVLAYLEKHPAARILVSAQSHYALDELAGRIKNELAERKRRRISPRPAADGPPADSGWEMHEPDLADPGAVPVEVDTDPLDAGVEPDDEQAQADAGQASEDDEGPILIRIATRHTDEQVRVSNRDLFDLALAEKRLKRITSDAWLGRVQRKYRPIAAEWRHVAPLSLSEIRDHLWRGANVLFATCGTSTKDHLGTHAEIDRFDWVIVEEAGKAWPLELTMPMVHGQRWTLIGDPKQLPPYGKDEVDRLYKKWKANKQHLQGDWPTGDREFEEAFEATFELFGRLFYPSGKQQERRASRTEGDKRHPWPVEMLDVQFRMHPDIARIVSGCFYEKPIRTWSALLGKPPAHGIQAPAFLRRRAVAWLDTREHSSCWYEERLRSSWTNPGEVDLIVALLKACGDALKVRPPKKAGDKKPDERLAILSPYQAQNKRLAEALAASGDAYYSKHYKSLIHTTDSFQGREAEVVVVSLVRTNDKTDPLGRIGHLADEKRANVLLSRAKQLIVLVGDLDHFRRTTGTKWPLICQIAEQVGGHVPYAEYKGPLEGLL